MRSYKFVHYKLLIMVDQDLYSLLLQPLIDIETLQFLKKTLEII